MNWLKSIIIIFVVVAFAGCDSYKKLQASSDYALKYEKAKEYYNDEDYFRAKPLFKDLLTHYKGQKIAEEIYYYWMYSTYHTEDYLFAAYQFDRFSKSFPKNEKAEEAAYMVGVCYAKFSPMAALDQEYTLRAIEEFQLFLEKFPDGQFTNKANIEVDKLIYKVEIKAFRAVKLYANVQSYQSAIVSADNFFKDFPDSKHVEEAYYLKIKSAFDYAGKSIEGKQVERYKNTVEYADKFIEKYDSSAFLPDVVKIKDESKNLIASITYNLPLYYYNKSLYNKAIPEFNRLLNKKMDADKKGKLQAYYLLSLYYEALEAEPDKRAEELTFFLKRLKKLENTESLTTQSEYQDLKNKEKSAEKLISELPFKIAKEYYDKLNFKKARKYYFEAAEKSVEKKDRFILLGLKSSLKLAESSDVFHQEELYKQVIADYESNLSAMSNASIITKSRKVKEKAEAELSDFPLKLFKFQYKAKKYLWVIQRSKEYLKNNKLGNHKEEIVYLWASSEYKLAKSAEKYERLKLFENAKTHVSTILTDVQMSAETKGKIEGVLEKVNNKIEKYNSK